MCEPLSLEEKETLRFLQKKQADANKYLARVAISDKLIEIAEKIRVGKSSSITVETREYPEYIGSSRKTRRKITISYLLTKEEASKKEET